jgi:ribosomal protein L18E
LSKNFGVLAVLALTSCAAVRQFPDDPAANSDATASYQQYFNAEWVTKYETAPSAQRQSVRDTIVINRMLAYDVAYETFKQQLLTEGNSINTIGDLIVLALSGLGATTGTATTKAALAAASAGIVGAKTAISSDLFYQRTLPALIAQMDANRATAKAAILNGLSRPDSDYPLVRAFVDLQQLSDAGSMIGAVGTITGDAAAKKSAAEASLTFARTAAYKVTFQTRKSLTDSIGKLSDAQILKLVQKADAIVASDEKAKAVLASFDRATLLTNAGVARTALQVAVAEGEGRPSHASKMDGRDQCGYF